MLLQLWDVSVRGRAHRVELVRNDETGKALLRVDGRVALKPFAEQSGGEFPLEIDGRPYLLRVRPGEYALEDREDALRRHVSGEPLSSILGDLESRSPTRVVFAGRGETIFLPR